MARTFTTCSSHRNCVHVTGPDGEEHHTSPKEFHRPLQIRHRRPSVLVYVAIALAIGAAALAWVH